MSNAQADTSCRILSNSQFSDLVRKSSDALSGVRTSLEGEVMSAVADAAHEYGARVDSLRGSGNRFLKNIHPELLFSQYLTDSDPGHPILHSSLDEDGATAAIYRARRAALSLFSLLPANSSLGAPLKTASGKTREAIVHFIELSAKFISNGDCKYAREVERSASAVSGKSAPLSPDAKTPVNAGQQCGNYETADMSPCPVEAPKPAPRAFVAPKDWSTGGMCLDQAPYKDKAAQ